MGIVIVFFVGLIKLWAANRHMRKFEQLDEEKQARIAQMRKSGLPGSHRSRRLGSEIPFGVKALEGGVEVEGVWVARMASMASRPPDRKWSSRRKKVRPPPALLAEAEGLAGSSPSKRTRRGSRRSGKISRREIVEPSQQTREKLENLSLLEEEQPGESWSGRDRSTALDDANNPSGRAHPNASHTGGGHGGGALGRIQRGLKKMTSSDTWREQARRQRQEGRRLDAKQFHEGAQAKKPQRFYPGPDGAALTAPLVAPQARSHATRQRVDNLLSAHGATQVPVPHNTVQRRAAGGVTPDRSSPTAVRRHRNIEQHASNDTPDTSAESFITSVEVPREPSPPSQTPGQETRKARDGTGMAQNSQQHPVPRRSSSLKRTSSRRDSSERKGSRERGAGGVRGEPSSAASAQRYPPNSSRSGPVVHTRSHSGGSLQEQHKQQPRSASSTTPSPASSFRDAYANTSKRRVNENFEILPAGTFTFSDQQQQQQHRDAVPRSEPASSAATSRRSSFESQSSGARRKLQKKRKSQG
ncbi:hypothetical protein OPQ81_001986 [Rhizoctonia solani]|nr:hypothetical protein OPQ81_001986 [Rhizoctonia solani]